MLVCTRCSAEMHCIKTGVGIRFGDSHVYPGDIFQCPKCHYTIIQTSQESFYDPDQIIPTLQMDGENKGKMNNVSEDVYNLICKKEGKK